MHTSKDDYLINTLIFVSRKETYQIYGAVLPECLTSPEMKESKAYKTYLGMLQKGKRVKRPAKKSTTTPAACIVIREAPVETKSKRKEKEKEKVDVAHGNGIELLSNVVLTEEAQIKEVRKKSLRDFHKTYPSGSSTVAKKPPSVEKITPTGNDEDDSNNDQESSNEGSDQENESEKQESDSEQEEESKDNDQEEESLFSYTDDKDDDDLESKSDDVIKSDEEKGMDDTTYQFDDEPTQTDKEVVQDVHVTISAVIKKTEVLVTSSSGSSDLAYKFLNFSYIPHADAEIVYPLDVHVHHEVPRTQAPTLLTILVSVITESSPVLTNIP
ncbi:hypothetical protein Tco_1242213 [Tanacetum coccineum]